MIQLREYLQPSVASVSCDRLNFSFPTSCDNIETSVLIFINPLCSSYIFQNQINQKLFFPILLARNNAMNGVSEPQVDMLDIPGKGRCCVFIARFPYDPPE